MVWYYAVRRGKKPGIYTSWPDCQEQIKDFKGPRYKKFATEEDAQAFVDGNDNPGDSKTGDEGKSNKGKRSKDDESSKKKQKTQAAEEDEEMDTDSPQIYTNGCCIFNGLKGSCGGIGVYWGNDHPKNVSERISGKPTKNSADILAACKAFEQLKEMGKNSAVLHTGNQYLINGASKWLKGWKKKGWKTATGEEVKNREEFEKLDDLLNGLKIKWVHVTEKDIEGKKISDKLAVAGAKKDLPEGDEALSEEEEEIDPDALKIYTDGCCINNGKNGACAGIGVYWGKDNPKNVSERVAGRQTNNRAEILAACKALEQVKEMDKDSVVLYTDSQFLINGATKWIAGWKRKGWKLAAGGDVKNREEFEVLDSLLSEMKVKWVYVAGHKGIEGNEAADRLAVAGAKKDVPAGKVAIVVDDDEDDDDDEVVDEDDSDD